jgi:glycolate oxidase FAD binding subunit
MAAEPVQSVSAARKRMSVAVLEPPDEAALAGVVRASFAAGEPLLVQGNGTKLGMLRPVQAARTLSTRALSGFSLYAPKELVMSAAAGTTIADVEARLAEHGQQLIAEPPDFSALLNGGGTGGQTLGGIVATNLSGPRRVAWGAVRDHVLGLRAVDGRGEVMRSGGRVLKNVTGLDMCKLLTGSHGTLGVMTEITLKVLPAAERTGTVVLAGLDAAKAVAALSAALGSPWSVSGAAYLPAEAAARLPGGGAGSLTLARIEDFAASVTYRTEQLRVALQEFGVAAIWDQAQSVAAWAAIRNAAVLPAEPDDALWRISVRPSRGAALLDAALQHGARGYLDWGGGLVMLAGPATEVMHDAITHAVLAAGGIWTLLRAPEPMRASVAVVPAEAPALAAIAKRVKAVMDPKGILNPGRMTVGI